MQNSNQKRPELGIAISDKIKCYVKKVPRDQERIIYTINKSFDTVKRYSIINVYVLSNTPSNYVKRALSKFPRILG